MNPSSGNGLKIVSIPFIFSANQVNAVSRMQVDDILDPFPTLPSPPYSVIHKVPLHSWKQFRVQYVADHPMILLFCLYLPKVSTSSFNYQCQECASTRMVYKYLTNSPEQYEKGTSYTRNTRRASLP